MNAKKFQAGNNNDDGDNDLTQTKFINPDDAQKLQENINESLKAPPSIRILQGSTQGKKFDLIYDKNIIGREPSCEIWIDDAAASRKHAELICQDQGAIVILRDLGSRNGLVVNNQKVTETILRHADVIQIGKTMMRFNAKGTIDRVAEENLIKSTNQDQLTGLASKRFINESLDREIKLGATNGNSIGLVVFDIDHFKHINDTFGHQAGDYVLATIPKVLDETVIPPFCTFGRWGGEEFIIIYPEGKHDELIKLCESIRSKMEKYRFMYQGARIPITVSVGCSVSKPGMEAEELFNRADKAMYTAKNSGRNRVCSEF